MSEIRLAAGRVFASHYQILICQDSNRLLQDSENWDHEASQRGFAGAPSYRIVGTEADLNDHWVELVLAQRPPNLDEWERVTCVDFRTLDGAVHVMSIIDNRPSISCRVPPGEYSAYFAAQNLGVDQLSLGEIGDGLEGRLTDTEIASRRDLEWYRIYLVPEQAPRLGILTDRN
ncbi:competence protein ComJ [Maricaulis sp. W15]|uniref:competence protein ComJ n=1 Tax=Maricaulis sp. W15 TaxID=1772333 RepID=UPI000A5638EE|nr:competence protein ComJ [Maricaulis sp. W15]